MENISRLCEVNTVSGTSADSIVPAGVQGYDRYAYVNNSPVNFVDPTGHYACGDGEKRDCDSNPKSIVRGDKGAFNTKEIGNFYVGPNAPKTLSEYEAESYSEHGMNNTPSGPYATFGDGSGALSDEVDQLGRRNNGSNVFVDANYELYRNGSIDVLSLTITNNSDSKLLVTGVIFTATENPYHRFAGNSCGDLDQCYSPNPPSLRETNGNNDYLETINRYSIEVVPLTPSGYLQNPNNHFGPQSSQTVDIRINFSYVAQPGYSFVINSLIP